ncbi:MAG: hypothetical protein GXY58_17695 [Planctomycetaceae bacterium]|nr:hypothetical protein [Planctomycetaceae bacterium]
MSMPRSWNKLIPGLIVAAFCACTALPALASVVIAERGDVVHENLGHGLLCACPLPCAADESADSCDHKLLLLAIELPAEDVQRSGSVPTNSPKCAAHSPQGMSPLPASFPQFGGSGVGGVAIMCDREVPQRDAFQATLAPELKLILPSGPVYRWFRPPRVWLYL